MSSDWTRAIRVYELGNRNLDGSVTLSVKNNVRNFGIIDRSFSNFHILLEPVNITTRFVEK